MEKLNENTENQQLSNDIEKADNDQIWEDNQAKIVDYIKNTFWATNKIPTTSEIARETGLSRKTVYKHISNYSQSPIKKKMEGFEVMTTALLSNLVNQAVLGNIAATRLFFQLSGALHHSGTQNNQQNNYLQINKTIVNQQVIQQLKPEQLSKLEEFIASELNKVDSSNGG